MSEGRVEVRERGMIAVSVRKNRLEVLKRPIEAETVPMNTGIALGRVYRVRLVDQTGFVCEGKEAVGHAHRKIEYIPIILGKFYSRGLSVGLRGATQIEKNIEDLPADAVNQLLMRSRWQLEVHAPQDAKGRFRKELLTYRQRDPVLGELAFMVGLDEISSWVAVQKGFEDFAPGEGFGEELHGSRFFQFFFSSPKQAAPALRQRPGSSQSHDRAGL